MKRQAEARPCAGGREQPRQIGQLHSSRLLLCFPAEAPGENCRSQGFCREPCFVPAPRCWKRLEELGCSPGAEHIPGGRDGTEGSWSRVVHRRVPGGADLTWVPRSVRLHRGLFIFTEEKLPAGRAMHEEPQAGRLPGLQVPMPAELSRPTALSPVLSAGNGQNAP